MYQKHLVCTPPPEYAVLWRYMDFTKYVSLLATRSLFFVRVDELEDPFEGSLSPRNVALRRLIYEDMADSEGEAIVNLIGEAYRQSRHSYLVNCWHENNRESDFMWKLYAKGNGGVAIKSTFESLKRCFTCEAPVYIGQVKYIDYEEEFVPEGNTLTPSLYKRKSFGHEREVRALTEASEAIPAKGELREVDLSVLVSEVFVAPYAEDWFKELVESVTRRFGQGTPVRRSALASRPVY